jgi:hypothetical protein
MSLMRECRGSTTDLNACGRGLSGARDEFLLAATVQNLKTLALRWDDKETAPARSFAANGFGL